MANSSDGSAPMSRIEDARGVDVVQIRRQLDLPVPGRVRTMVEAENRMLELQRHAADLTYPSSATTRAAASASVAVSLPSTTSSGAVGGS